MTGGATRVAFAGLAHSHPYSDAENLLAFGAEVVGVVDADARAAAEFAARFGGVAVPSAGEIRLLRADVVIATPRPHECVPLLRALTAADASTPVFFNKVVAATAAQLEEWDEATSAASVPVGTSSVLRFAPAIEELAHALSTEEILSVRVLAQHDNTAFQLPGREWQDDPARGGGTLVTVGVHAWELIDRMLPGAHLDAGTGWAGRRTGSTTRSEDAGGLDGRLRLTDADHSVPVQVLVTGVPGPDAYAVEVVTARGIRSVDLDVTDANDALGFAGLIRSLLAESAAGRVPAPWARARTVVENTIRAAEIARLGAPRDVTRRIPALHNRRCSCGLNPPDSSSDLAM